MKKYVLISITLLGCSYQLLASKKMVGRDTTKNNQAITIPFAPGAIPTEEKVTLSPAFSPDGNSVYFGQISGDKPMAIKVSTYKNSHWSAPQTAAFSGTYTDLEPAFAPNGKYIVFASSRPVTAGGALIDGHYNNAVYTGKGGNLWKVELNKKVWGTPQLLPELINVNTSVFSPAVAGDNSLYFMRADNGGIFHIYRAQMTNGKY
ncbi:MAG: TolB family protein, partial [Mucilaginibacter sp.]